jgi:hypothetical protein
VEQRNTTGGHLPLLIEERGEVATSGRCCSICASVSGGDCGNSRPAEVTYRSPRGHVHRGGGRDGHLCGNNTNALVNMFARDRCPDPSCSCPSTLAKGPAGA